MRHHILKIGVIAAALAASAAACSTPPSVGGTAAPQTNGVDAAGKLPSGAPHVANPLDTTKAQAAPCSVLTATQISSLGIVATGKPGNPGPGPKCSWDDTTAVPTPTSIGSEFITGSTGGLSSLYVQAESLKKVGGYFEPTESVQGYPVVLYSQYDDRRAKTNATCALAVGVSDSLQFTVVVTVTTLTQQNEPCATAKKVADMEITTLKAGT